MHRCGDGRAAAAQSDGALVLLGEARPIRTASGKPQEVERGEVVLLDCGCAVHGYQSDISRTFVFGADPTAEQRKVWDADAPRPGHRHGRRQARRAGRAASMTRCARAYESWGYGPGYKLPGTVAPHRPRHRHGRA